MRKKKLPHLSREQEKIRENQAYQHYNIYAQLTVNRGELLTNLKENIAKIYNYKGYQSIANLISKNDKNRRLKIDSLLNSLEGEKFVIKIQTDGRINNKNSFEFNFDTFSFKIIADHELEFFNNCNDSDCAIKRQKIEIHSAKNGKDIMYLKPKDLKEISEFFNKKLIFDIEIVNNLV